MKAWEFLERNEWARDNYAKDKNGDVVPVNSPAACSFCALGAVRAIYGKDDDNLWETIDKIEIFLREVIKKETFEDFPQIFGQVDRKILYYRAGSSTVARFNDHFTVKKENVIALLKHLDI